MIPSGIFSLYYNVMDEFLENTYISSSCTVNYPAKKESCSNCVNAWFGGVNKNTYKSGGPAPFSTGNCPLCGGNGLKESISTDTLNLRIYWRRRDWIKIGNVNIPDAEVQVIGFASDLPKILRATDIELVTGQNYLKQKFQLANEPAMHGFGKNRYFIAYLKRA